MFLSYDPAIHAGADHAPLTEHDKIKDLKGISMIGYVTKPELGAAMVTRDGAELPITAQGWNAFTK